MAIEELIYDFFVDLERQGIKTQSSTFFPLYFLFLQSFG